MITKTYWRNLDVSINRKGIGTWQFSGEYNVNDKPHGWRKIDFNSINKILNKAVDDGVQFFDTANGYGNGVCEDFLGKILKKRKEEIFICTKIGLSQTALLNNAFDNKFMDDFFNSLKRLQRERIDVLLIHSPPDDLNYKTFDFSFLNNMQSSGLIGTYGVSSNSIKGALNALESNFGSVIEWVFNLLERRPINDIFPLVKNKRYNFIARSPLNRGFLNNSNINKTPLDFKGQFRSTLNPKWVEWASINSKKIIQNINEKPNLAGFALEFCLSFDDVSVIIPGINSLEYLEDYLAINYGLENVDLYLKNLQELTNTFNY